MNNLTLLDKKILYELDIDARQPISKLAKKLQKKRNTIEYRIKRLQAEGIIKNFVTLVDAEKLGLTIWNVYLEFQDMNSRVEKKIIDHLKKSKKVWWVAQTTGKYDFIYSVYIKNIKEFYNIVQEFNSKFSKYILKQDIVAHVEVDVFSRGYFLDKPAVSVKWSKESKKEILDEIDKKILRLLSTNARMSSVDLAEEIGSTPRIVIYRINELEKKGVITRFRLQLDVKKIGYSFYKVIVNLKEFSKEQDDKLREYCKKLGNIFHYEKKMGSWMLELEMDIENYEKANELMKEMKEKFSDYMKSFDLMLITDEPKGELDLTQQL
jgi:Lrp/AsnC family transcriptional regulator, leucine-responsive regulatory protein